MNAVPRQLPASAIYPDRAKRSSFSAEFNPHECLAIQKAKQAAWNFRLSFSFSVAALYPTRLDIELWFY
jgi:hypothetical protein